MLRILMFVDQHKEVECDLTNPRIAVYKKHWKIFQNTVYWCNLKVAQKKGLQFYPTRSNAIILYNTLPAILYTKSGEGLYNKVYQSPRLPQRAVLKPNLYHGRQDSSKFEARTSVDHQSKESEEYGEHRGDSNSYRGTEEVGETRSRDVDFRIQGLLGKRGVLRDVRELLGKADVIRATHERVQICQGPQEFDLLRESMGHTILQEQWAAEIYEEVEQRSHERLFPGLTEASMTQATLSAGQSGIGYKRATSRLLHTWPS